MSPESTQLWLPHFHGEVEVRLVAFLPLITVGEGGFEDIRFAQHSISRHIFQAGCLECTNQIIFVGPGVLIPRFQLNRVFWVISDKKEQLGAAN